LKIIVVGRKGKRKTRGKEREEKYMTN